ncbi:MAG: tetratricopeptide repeat protein, partial [Myxococcales bacterium]|nr:tetratricopeptide repeat protein [Myxococcales bacterium]
LEFETEDFGAAEGHFREASETFARVDGPEHVRTLTAEFGGGESLVRAGKVQAGLAKMREVVNILRGRPDDAALFAWGLLTIAETHLDRGDLSDAETAFRESLAVYAGLKKPDVSEVARARFGMAKTLAALDKDADRALPIATSALQGLGKAEPELRGAIEGWIAAHSRARG